MTRPDIRNEPFATEDEFEELMVTDELPAPRPCECPCTCFGECFTDAEPPICLACLHGYHIEDE